MTSEYSLELRGPNIHLVKKGAWSRNVGRVAIIEGKKVFICPRKSAIHFMKIDNSWHLAEIVVTWLAMHQIEEVHLLTKKNRLVSTVLDWQTYGTAYKHPKFEHQTALHKTYFKQISRKTASIFMH